MSLPLRLSPFHDILYQAVFSDDELFLPLQFQKADDHGRLEQLNTDYFVVQQL